MTRFARFLNGPEDPGQRGGVNQGVGEDFHRIADAGNQIDPAVPPDEELQEVGQRSRHRNGRHAPDDLESAAETRRV